MKVKCVLCGKIGLANDKIGLLRHLQLAHNKNDIKMFFTPTKSEIINIFPTTKKAYIKKQSRKISKKFRKEQIKKEGKPKHKSIYWGAVLKSAFESKR